VSARRTVHPSGVDEGDDHQHDDHADDGAHDAAEIERVVITDAEALRRKVWAA
jgi:hypothetical protein